MLKKKKISPYPTYPELLSWACTTGGPTETGRNFEKKIKHNNSLLVSSLRNVSNSNKIQKMLAKISFLKK